MSISKKEVGRRVLSIGSNLQKTKKQLMNLMPCIDGGHGESFESLKQAGNLTLGLRLRGMTMYRYINLPCGADAAFPLQQKEIRAVHGIVSPDASPNPQACWRCHNIRVGICSTRPQWSANTRLPWVSHLAVRDWPPGSSSNIHVFSVAKCGVHEWGLVLVSLPRGRFMLQHDQEVVVPRPSPGVYRGWRRFKSICGMLHGCYIVLQLARGRRNIAVDLAPITPSPAWQDQSDYGLSSSHRSLRSCTRHVSVLQPFGSKCPITTWAARPLPGGTYMLRKT